ncbi:MAG: tetratricopeptide repeat protein [Planctomycetota bacterium]|jgi:tetratricopeptide (TPR) repeat protein
MSRLLEILGRAITIDTADLIWHWLENIQLPQHDDAAAKVRQLKRVVALVRDRKIETARDQLRLYLFDHPECVYGRLAAAAICLTKSQLQEAVGELTSVYTRQPSNTMALYALGHCYERLGKEAEAVEFYQDCLKFKNYLQLPRQRLAAIYFKNGQLEKTVHEHELLRQEYPDDISTLVTLGHLYVAASKYAQAVETFNTAILIHPDNFCTQEDPIDQLIREGQLHESLQMLEQLSQQQPGRADLALRHADILSIMGDAAEAIIQYQEAINLCPDFLEANIKLGTQYLQTDQLDLAARQFNNAVEINDQIVDAYIGLATAQKLAGSASDALTTLSLAAAIQPNSSLLLAETATLQFLVTIRETSEPDHQRPLQDLMPLVLQSHHRQVTDRPHNPDLQYRFGALLMSTGNLHEAANAFHRALEINPTFSRARTKLAICLYETGRQDAALSELSEPDVLDKDSLQLHYKTALLYCDKIRFASSLINLVRNLEDNFAHPDAAVNIAVVLQNLGLLDRAAAMWENLADTTHQAINSNYPF